MTLLDFKHRFEAFGEDSGGEILDEVDPVLRCTMSGWLAM